MVQPHYSLSRGQSTTFGRFLKNVVLLSCYYDFDLHIREANNHWWYFQNSPQITVRWALERKNFGTKNSKIKNSQIALTLKSYYEYHIWGFQNRKKWQNIPTGKGYLHDLKNCDICIGWAEARTSQDILRRPWLKVFLTDLGKWPLLRPNWGLTNKFWYSSIKICFVNPQRRSLVILKLIQRGH